jgi:hypothetical protein
MHRRFLFPLAAGVVGLVAISPAFASGTSPGKAGKSPSKATTTSAAPSNNGSPSNNDPNAGSPSENGSSPDSGGADSSAPTTAGKGGSTPTTAAPAPGQGQGGGGSSGAPGSSSNCAPPQTDQGPAPQVGEAPQNHAAGDAGSVDVERLSPTELRVAKAAPNDGWQQQVTAPSGPRVTVKFARPGSSPSVVRFAASMDQAGRMIHIRVQACG